MSMSLQEVSDRFEIQDLIVEYCHIIDKQLFDELGNVFSEDAFIDYTVMGGPKGNLAEIKEFLAQSLPIFKNTQHMISNYQIKLDGDDAVGRIMCFNPMQFDMADQGDPVFFIGLWYVDKYVRTKNGWRIKERVEEKSYDFNAPEFMNFES